MVSELGVRVSCCPIRCIILSSHCCLSAATAPCCLSVCTLKVAHRKCAWPAVDNAVVGRVNHCGIVCGTSGCVVAMCPPCIGGKCVGWSMPSHSSQALGIRGGAPWYHRGCAIGGSLASSLPMRTIRATKSATSFPTWPSWALTWAMCSLRLFHIVLANMHVARSLCINWSSRSKFQSPTPEWSTELASL